ncbi:MAG: acyl-CoA thioesterase [Lachnospiraceae bacterium]|nr:acyl-CoA thioesterase [Lachnospiraceae bacterium]
MYKHKVQYYETDKMLVTHHSNYIRWMEEARVDFLDRMGWPYTKLEELGIISPVIAVNGKYKKSTTFGDEVTIDVKIKEFKGVKLKLSYDFVNQNGEAVFSGESEHCFLTSEGKPMMIRVTYPDFYNAIMETYEKQ